MTSVTRTYSLLAALLPTLLACNDSGAVAQNANQISVVSKTPLTLVVGGIVYTAHDGEFAEAFAFRDKDIVAIGNNEHILELREPDSRVLELEGKLVLPGLHDSHVHLLEANTPLSACRVSAGQVPSELINRLQQCAPTQPLLEWVLGFGWDIDTFMASGENPLEAIDTAIPNRPAAIMEQTSHAVWVNSSALSALGITASTANPPGGHIAKDDSGQPTGLLIDNAGDLAFEAALRRTPEIDEQHYQGLLVGLAQLASNGITSFADARVYWTRGYHEFYKRAAAEGRLTARAVLGLWGYPQMEDASQIPALASMFSSGSQSLVRASQIKVYMDGITQNTTARTLRDYLIDYGFGTPRGLNYFSEGRLTRYLRELTPKGFDFHIHAIGAGGVREALNAIEAASQPDADLLLASTFDVPRTSRHRITHVEHVHPDDIGRFVELGVIADIQLAGDFTEPSQFAQDNDPFIGSDNPALPLPARALIDAGATVTLSSDFDVSALNPFVGIANAVTRSPGSLSVREAVDAYTVNAAYLMRHEEDVGTLVVGRRADFVIVDQNVFEIPKAQIDQTEVLVTFFEGREVFRSSRF